MQDMPKCHAGCSHSDRESSIEMVRVWTTINFRKNHVTELRVGAILIIISVGRVWQTEGDAESRGNTRKSFLLLPVGAKEGEREREREIPRRGIICLAQSAVNRSWP